MFYKASLNSRQNSCERPLLVLVRIDIVYPATNLLMFSTIGCKSVFKVLSFSIEMQFSTDLALRTPNQLIKVDDAAQILSDAYPDGQTALRGNF